MFVIVGANGKTGGAVARALLAKGQPVRVVLHSDRSADRWRAAGAEVVLADVQDPASLIVAFRGAQAAYVLNPPEYGVDDLLVPARRVADAYRSALSATGVRAVALSSIGAQHAEGIGNILSNHIVESALAPLGTTFVRAGNFMTNWLPSLSVLRPGVLSSFLAPLDQATPTVAVPDIATVVVRELLSTGSRTVEVTGPADYSPNQVAAAFATAFGRPVDVEVIPRERWFEVLTTKFGFPEGAVGNWIQMWDGFNSGHIRFEGTPERGQLTIEEFAATAVATQEARV
jgi:uncharacterized protein YbjT (DUF2867 family)